MSNPSRLFALAGFLLCSLCTAPIARAAYADPSGRVARVNHAEGEVSYSPAGEDQWLNLVRNRPLIRGDRLWTDRDARAELQVGSAAIRLGPNTGLEFLDLNDHIAQLEVTQGTLNLRVRHLYAGQSYEVATPTLAFIVNQAGRYRIDVDPQNDQTTITVWEGAGEAYGKNASFPLRAGDAVRFYDADLGDYEIFGLPREDDFDRYALERDQRLDRSASLRYLDDEVVGYADLDEYGSWRPVRSYGNVWFPERVDADWAPYRDGHWVWQEPWGWTWVDNAPWGFAPSHYGRWVFVADRWGWIPGPRNVRPIYAPALVAFLGGRNWSVSLSFGGGSPIGWFALGPREVYVPSYHVSRDYFTRVNVNNTVINNTTINTVYNNYASGNTNVRQVNYANREIAGAVTAVPSTVFVNARPVRQAALRLDRNASTSGEVMRIAPLAPSTHSVFGTGTAARARPSGEAFDREVFARHTPPPGERPFAARERQLQKTPGRALEPHIAKSVQNGDANGAQNVRVIAQPRAAVDARAAGSRRGGESNPLTAAPTQLRQLDRSADDGKERGRGRDNRQHEEVRQQLERAGQNEGDQQQAAEQQRGERQRQAETQQQEQRQRQADSDQQQAAEQQRGERQRQAETQQQEQRQRQADSDQQQAVEQQRGERQRQAETQQQEQRQRKADSDQQQAAEQQRGERQRQAETQQQEQRQRQADSDQQQAAEQQRGERQRQAETQQQETRGNRADKPPKKRSAKDRADDPNANQD